MDHHKQSMFSVVVVSFNPGDKIKKTLESVLAQTYTDFEIVIKDAGSTDGSLKEIPADDRIRLISKKDRGIYDGMNHALDEVHGKYIYFLNCGDYLHDEAVLEKLASFIEAEEKKLQNGDRTGAIYYGDVIERKTGQHVAANPNMSHFAMFRYLPCHQACIYDRKLFQTERFDLAYAVRADYEHFLRSVIRFHARAIYCPLIIADYEGGGFSETAEGIQKSRVEHKKITEEYFSKKELWLFRAYLVVTLQPLREKLAQSEKTAKIYDSIKNGIYRLRR